MKTEIFQKKSLPNWEELLQVAEQNTTAKWISRPGQTPATATISSYLHRLNSGAINSIKIIRQSLTQLDIYCDILDLCPIY